MKAKAVLFSIVLGFASMSYAAQSRGQLIPKTELKNLSIKKIVVDGRSEVVLVTFAESAQVPIPDVVPAPPQRHHEQEYTFALNTAQNSFDALLYQTFLSAQHRSQTIHLFMDGNFISRAEVENACDHPVYTPVTKMVNGAPVTSYVRKCSTSGPIF